MEEAISTAALTALPPDQDDANVAQDVYQGREFSNHDDPTFFGDPRPHQRNLLAFLDPQTDVKAMAVFWATGLGKGFTMAEMIKVILKRQNASANKGNRIMIIVKDSVKAQWQTELSKYPEFTTKKIRDEESTYKIKGREKAISSAIAKVVKIVSLDAFALQVMNMSGDAIREQFSCDMVVIDEVHFLRIDKEIGMENLDSLTRWPAGGGGAEFDAKIAYLMMHKFFSHAEIGLKVIATATPMYNKPTELVSIMSFILPPERSLTFAAFETAVSQGKAAIKEYLKPRLSGYVTFVSDKAGLSPIFDKGKTFMFDDGSGLRESTIKIVECPMLEEQEAVYLQVLQDEKDQREMKQAGLIDSDRRPGAFKSATRQALSFVYIDPNNPFRNTQKGFEYFEDPDDKDSKQDGFVKMIPAKRLTVVEKKALEAKGERRKNLRPTIFQFRYEDDLFAGCAPRNRNLKKFDPLDEDRLQVIRRMSARFAKIIEIVHYDLTYPGEGEMAYYYNPYVKSGGGILLGMCFHAVGYEVFHGNDADDASRISDKPRYAYMTGDPGSTGARSRNIRMVANHPANAFGDKITIVIASDTTSVGLSFTNARKIIHNGAVFNLPRQPEGRVNRTDSHRNFKEDRQRFVKRYYMACTMEDGSQTADHKMWWDVQQKEASITPTEEVLKEISWDAGMYPGAIRDGFKGLPTNFTRYHLHHAQDEFYRIEKEIRRAFQIKPSWTFSELQNLMGYSHRPDTLCWSLRGMLDRREVITDRFGFMKVLREHSGLYFISNPVETIGTHVDGIPHTAVNHDILEIEYSTGLRMNTFEDFKTISTAAVQEAIKGDDSSLEADMTNWENSDSEAGHRRMIRLEQALLGQIKDENIKKFILTDLAVTWFTYGEYYFHYLDAMRPKGNEGAYQYNRHRIDSTKNTVSLRVAKKGDKVFRPARAQETIIFIQMINKRWFDRDAAIQAKKGKDVKFTVMKLVSSDRQIRIRDDSKMRYKKDGEPDGRSHKGQLGSLYDPTQLVEFLYQMGVENPEAEPTRTRKEDIKSEIKQQLGSGAVKDWSIDKVKFFYSWLGSGNKTSKDRLITALADYALEEDLLFLK